MARHDVRRFWRRLLETLRPDRREEDAAREIAAHAQLLEDDLLRGHDVVPRRTLGLAAGDREAFGVGEAGELEVEGHGCWVLGAGWTKVAGRSGSAKQTGC